MKNKNIPKLKNVLKRARNLPLWTIVALLIGFMLSPLSWWNDILTNIPLAYGMAYVIGGLFSYFFSISLVVFLTIMAFAYIFTNFLGIYILQHTMAKIYKNRKKNEINLSWKHSALFSVLSVAVVYLSIESGLIELNQLEHMMTSVLDISYLK